MLERYQATLPYAFTERPGNGRHQHEKDMMRAGDYWSGTNGVSLLLGLLLCMTGLMWPAGVLAVDETAARDLAQSSGCFKCHGVDKKKDGPAFRDSAAKYKGDPNAEAKLIYHVTSGEKVKFDDGHEEEHKKVKTKDPAETRNLVDWILALPGGTKP